MIKVHKKEDGLWIEFTGIGGKSATLNVASLAEKYGPITGAAIILACAEAALSASAPAPTDFEAWVKNIYDGGYKLTDTERLVAEKAWNASRRTFAAAAPAGEVVENVECHMCGEEKAISEKLLRTVCTNPKCRAIYLSCLSAPGKGAI